MNRTEHLLTILAEECAEVAQRASKALRFGLTEVEPGQQETNQARIRQEFADLLATYEMLHILMPTEAMVAAKKQKVERFLEYSRKQGSLRP